ncbi:MAG: xanthine dehydrogenase family protein subunit M [Candidatus Binatia bacterium]
MKPSPFAYYAPHTMDEACDILARQRDGAKVLAGGQSLVPLLNLRLAKVDHLVDINRVSGLDQIRVAADGVRIGARVTQADVERSAEVKTALPLLTAGLAHVGHHQIRNRGTVVGSICHADPAAELPALWLAVGGELTAKSASGTRTIRADDFFVSYFTTVLQPNEVATEVKFDAGNGSGWSMQEVARRHGDFALVGVVAHVSVGNGSVSGARLVVFGAGATPIRAHAAEQALCGAGARKLDAGVLDAAAGKVAATVAPVDDVHASADYRRYVAGVLTKRAIGEAVQRAVAAA